MTIDVGLPTFGPPQLEYRDGLHLLRNLKIGNGFHWQKSVDAFLPGEVVLSENPDFQLVNRLPLETYLQCVVGSEMNPSAPVEFLKAHAVISRSWAVGKVIGMHPASAPPPRKELPDGSLETKGWDDTSAHIHSKCGFHVCSDDHCQRYQGLQPIPPGIADAISTTTGMVLTDAGGNLIDARFSKCCGGRTELFESCWQDIHMPSLESFEDPWCDLSVLPETKRNRILDSVLKDYDRNTPAYRWQTVVSKEEIARNLKTKFGIDASKVSAIVPVKRGPSGRITQLRVVTPLGDIILGKELWIRRLLSSSHLYSSAFEITDLGDTVELRGSGWGHGVGLCQIGAARMAAEGFGWKEILAFYYPGACISIRDGLKDPKS